MAQLNYHTIVQFVSKPNASLLSGIPDKSPEEIESAMLLSDAAKSVT